MTARARLLTALKGIAARGAAHSSELLQILSYSRQLMESEGTKNRYPTLSLYADWTLHSTLDRGSAKRVLKRVQEVFARETAGETLNLVAEVSRRLAMSELRAELRELLLVKGLPTFLVDSYTNWTWFARAVLVDLLEKPLVGSPFTEEEKRTGWGTTPRTIRLRMAEKPPAPVPGLPFPEYDAVEIQWVVELGPNVQVAGAFLESEPRAAFSHD